MCARPDETICAEEGGWCDSEVTFFLLYCAWATDATLKMVCLAYLAGSVYLCPHRPVRWELNSSISIYLQFTWLDFYRAQCFSWTRYADRVYAYL
eukprot:1196965-Pleurochrysis_carterae.AAC.1